MLLCTRAEAKIWRSSELRTGLAAWRSAGGGFARTAKIAGGICSQTVDQLDFRVEAIHRGTSTRPEARGSRSAPGARIGDADPDWYELNRRSRRIRRPAHFTARHPTSALTPRYSRHVACPANKAKRSDVSQRTPQATSIRTTPRLPVGRASSTDHDLDRRPEPLARRSSTPPCSREWSTPDGARLSVQPILDHSMVARLLEDRRSRLRAARRKRRSPVLTPSAAGIGRQCR